jgi:hypothetical protein
LRKLGIIGHPPEDAMGVEYGSYGLVKIGGIEKSVQDIIGQGIVEIVWDTELTCIQRISGKYITIKSCRLVDSHEALPD